MTPLDLAAIEKAAKEQKPFGWRYLDSFSGDDDWSITFDVNEATAITEASKDDATYRCEPLFPDQSATILALCARIREPAKVKPLVWSPDVKGGLQAVAAGLGRYVIHRDGDNWYLGYDHMGTGGRDAAQADYESRIRSALIQDKT